MSTMVRRFLKQAATWEPLTASDPYTGDTYGTPVPIRVRWFNERELVLTSEAEEVTSSAHISCLEAVKVGDRITDEEGRRRKVITTRRNRATRGAFSHYVAYLL